MRQLLVLALALLLLSALLLSVELLSLLVGQPAPDVAEPALDAVLVVEGVLVPAVALCAASAPLKVTPYSCHWGSCHSVCRPL